MKKTLLITLFMSGLIIKNADAQKQETAEGSILKIDAERDSNRMKNYFDNMQNIWLVFSQVKDSSRYNRLMLLEDNTWQEIRMEQYPADTVKLRPYYDPEKNGYLIFELNNFK